MPGETLRVAMVIRDTEAEGPGRRYAIWVQGCSLRCPGCCNPEMLAPHGGREVEVDALVAEAAATEGVEGISVLGGEPMEQPAALARLCQKARARGLSVMVYTGYTLAELRAMRNEHVDAALASCDLLVDGRYVKELPERRRRWIGSSNQVLHFLSNRYAPDDVCFQQPNTLEIRLVDGRVVVNGWPAGARGVMS